jgi:hypothetical protein
MSEKFCQPTETIIESLIQVFKHQNKLETVNLLENSEATIEQTDYDNWDGGTLIFTLFLNIPLKLFANLESRIDQFEEAISKKLKSVLRDTGNHRLSHVVIAPILANPTTSKSAPKPTVDDISRIWQPNCLRLFLSHISTYKTVISSLKDELRIYGISGFVAHEDIEPTKEWENEIFLALNSANALAAFFTLDFHKSKWTDQEIGIALGRGLIVIPISVGFDPYGFMAGKQAMRGSFEKIDQLAIDLIDILLKHHTTSKLMHEVLVISLKNADSFINARRVSKMIIGTNNFTQEQLSRIQEACKNNDQVAKSFGVPERIDNYLNERGFKTDDVPF